VTSEEKLKSYFEGSFNLVVSTVFIMRDKLGRSRGFGFVIFEDDDVGAIIGNNHTLDGRMIEVKRAIPKNKIKTKKLFVGGLPLNISEEKFKKYFQQFGKVTECNIMKDRQTGQPRGFGFISFDDFDVIEMVLEQTHIISGKKVEVKVAEPKKFRDSRESNGTEEYVDYVPMSYPQFYSPQIPYSTFTPPVFQPSYGYVDMYANQMNMGFNSIFTTNFPSFVPPSKNSNLQMLKEPSPSVPLFELDASDVLVETEVKLDPFQEQDLSKIVGGHRGKKRNEIKTSTQSLFLNDILDGKDERHSFSGFRDFANEFGIQLDFLAEEGRHRNTWS